jgi:DNA repair exonuclease SbcCD ATPase subunit
MEFLRQRLEPQVVELEQHLATRDIELREMRKEAELSLLQLHQVQEELEHYFLADAEKKRRLEVADQDLEELRQSKAALESSHELELEALRQRSLLVESEKGTELKERVQELEQLHRTMADQNNTHAEGLEALRKRLEPQIEELEQRLASRDTELRESREEAESSLLQLHQVQEELEHYFLKARASDQLAQAQLEQLQRAQALMVRMHPGVLPTDSYPPALAVEVLPEVSIALTDPSLQTKALLSTYAASLQRASALLERARRT